MLTVTVRRRTTSDRSGATSAHTTTGSTNILPVREELRRQSSDHATNPRSGKAKQAVVATRYDQGQGMDGQLGVVSHSCDRVVTPVLHFT